MRNNRISGRSFGEGPVMIVCQEARRPWPDQWLVAMNICSLACLNKKAYCGTHGSSKNHEERMKRCWRGSRWVFVCFVLYLLIHGVSLEGDIAGVRGNYWGNGIWEGLGAWYENPKESIKDYIIYKWWKIRLLIWLIKFADWINCEIKDDKMLRILSSA